MDPAVFPPSLVNALKADVEGSDQGGDTWVYKRKVVLHTLMAGIGTQCNVNRLAQALEVCVRLNVCNLSGEKCKYFQKS